MRLESTSTTEEEVAEQGDQSYGLKARNQGPYHVINQGQVPLNHTFYAPIRQVQRRPPETRPRHPQV